MNKIIKIVSKGEYNYAYVPSHPNATKNGYVLEHRVIMENSINRLLTNKEIVHHKDGNKKNNLLSNLELMTRAEHTSHHNPKLHRKALLTCANCETLFQRDWRNRPEAKGQTNAFCSRSCNGKFQREQQLAQAS
jgi:hypothetical protein